MAEIATTGLTDVNGAMVSFESAEDIYRALLTVYDHALELDSLGCDDRKDVQDLMGALMTAIKTVDPLALERGWVE